MTAGEKNLSNCMKDMKEKVKLVVQLKRISCGLLF